MAIFLWFGHFPVMGMGGEGDEGGWWSIWSKTESSCETPLKSARLGAHLHQASASRLRQLCNDASNSVLIEIRGVAWKWVANPFLSASCFLWEQNCKRCCSIEADAWCKWALTISFISRSQGSFHLYLFEVSQNSSDSIKLIKLRKIISLEWNFLLLILFYYIYIVWLLPVTVKFTTETTLRNNFLFFNLFIFAIRCPAFFHIGVISIFCSFKKVLLHLMIQQSN